MVEPKQKSALNDALEAAYRERRGQIHAVVARGGGEDSADLVQDAFLKTIEAGRAAELASPLAFLKRVARNSVIDRVRSRARWARVVTAADPDFDRPDPTPDAEHSLIASERLRRALACIDAMPPRRREVFLLQRIEGMTYVKIANRLGISAKTVEDHMSAAMAQLSREMDGHDERSD